MIYVLNLKNRNKMMTPEEIKNTDKPQNQQLNIAGVSNSAYFGKVCNWCKSTITHYDYVTIEGGEVYEYHRSFDVSGDRIQIPS